MLKNILSSIQSTQELIANPKKIKEIMLGISKNTWIEITETGNMMEILWQLSLGNPVSDEDKAKAFDQAKDLAKSIPAFGIFLLPGGMILLPILAKVLPWDLIPSAFKDNSKNQDNTDK